jgi:ubiquitin-conjugating enzyme E2 D/E
MTTAGNNRRIVKEYTDLEGELKNGCRELVSMEMVKKSLSHWYVVMRGPDNTPYKDGLFKLEINFPSEFPFRPPQVKFLTKIYHPNINSGGSICLDILKENWSPALTIHKTLLSISSLLSDPNPNDPLDHDAAAVYKNDRPQYNTLVKEWIKNYGHKLN